MSNKIPETLSWQSLSQIDYQRSANWYLGLAIVAIGLLAFAIYNKSLITGITFALIILVVFVLSTQRPREVACRIGKTGISVGNTLYPYKIIKTFWIIYNPPEVKTLNFETTAYLNNQTSVQLDRQNPVEVKLVLSQYLSEDLNREESISETLARKLKI